MIKKYNIQSSKEELDVLLRAAVFYYSRMKRASYPYFDCNIGQDYCHKEILDLLKTLIPRLRKAGDNGQEN